jgi:Undecaprenyl-phosphate glucose phosphotransferase
MRSFYSEAVFEQEFQPTALTRARRNRSSLVPLIPGAARVLDAGVILLAACFSGLLYPVRDPELAIYVCVPVFLSLACINMFGIAGMYEPEALRSIVDQSRRLFASWTFAFILLVVGVFMLRISSGLSRGWVATWYLAGAAALMVNRTTLYILLQRWSNQGSFVRKVIVIGGPKLSQRFVAHARRDQRAGIAVVKVISDRDLLEPGAHGKLEEIRHIITENSVETILIALPLSAEKRITRLARMIGGLPIDIKLLPDVFGLKLVNKRTSYLADIPVLDIANRPIYGWNAIFKLLEDRIIALASLIIFAPLLLAIGLLIRLQSTGPTLFRQKRLGFNNQCFEMLKFRTMYTHLTDNDATRLVTRNDPRVTPIGRVLRRTSLDELPQLINVLRGDMSLVGPRPHALHAKAADRLYHDSVGNYGARHRVKPGITGWAQVNGWRGETDTLEKIQARVEHDLYYIEHWSVAFDIWIMFLTLFRVFRMKHVY